MNESGREATFALLRQLAVALQRLFAPLCEVVIHDFADFEHSIVHIEGNVSSRQLGGAATDLLLERARAGDTDSDLYCYKTRLGGDRVMKSLTIFLRDDDGHAYGAFCVNYDITALSEIEKIVGAMTLNGVDDAVSEMLSDDINETIRGIISETLAEIEGEPCFLSRDGKIDFVSRLDSRGIFQVKKAAPIVAEQLGLSRATVYNYLKEARLRSTRHSNGASTNAFNGVAATTEASARAVASAESQGGTP